MFVYFHNLSVFLLYFCNFMFLVFSYKCLRYGYVTNTKVKFVIVVESINSSLRDNEIRSVSNLNLF